MKKRIDFIIHYYISWVLVFMLQKPLFMLFTGACGEYAFKDFLRVMWHGIPLDMSVAGYLTGIPILAVMVGVWWPEKHNFNVRKVLFPYHAVISVILSIIFITDISLYPFWHFKIDATVFAYLATPKETAASVNTWYIIIRILAMIVFAYLLCKHLNRISPHTMMPEENANGRRYTSTFALLCLCGLAFLAIRGGTKESTMNVGRVYFSEDQYLNHSAINPAFSLFSTIGKNYNFDKQYKYFDNEKLTGIVQHLYPDSLMNPSEKNEYLCDTLLNTKRPNILVIEMESYGGAFIQALGAPADIAPNYNALIKKGIFFSNFYGNSYRTDRGTVSIFSGIPALPVISLMKIPNISRSLPGISKELVKNGYSTDFLYGGDINFTDTKGYLINIDFQKITADKDFTKEERHSNAWGVNDHITFEWLKNQLIERGNNNNAVKVQNIADNKDGKSRKPWFYAFLTLSSHEPFKVPYHRLSDKVYNAAAYTDDCLGKFIRELSSSQIWDNLLVIILPDHNMTYNIEDSDPDYFRCPMLWLGGAIKGEPRTVNRFMNQSDLASTLLAQMGLPHNSFKYSKNILSGNCKNDFAFSCYNNGFVFRDSSGVTSFDLSANKVVKNLENKRENNQDIVNKEGENSRIYKGKAILQSLYGTFEEMDRKSK